jgi:hypothetical protein
MKFVTADTRLLSLMLVIGAIGGTFAIAQSLNVGYDHSTTNGGTLFMGNVKVTQFGPDGSVIAYRQSDNHIVKQGMEIIMSQVFGDMNGTYPSGISTHPVRYMAIGTGADTNRLLYNDTDLAIPVSDTFASCARFRVDPITNSSSAHGYSQADGSDLPGSPGVKCGEAGGGSQDCSAQMNVTATRQFLGGAPDLCAINGIDEAAIYDDGTLGNGYMFARNTFGSVDLGNLDTLQLDWEFTFTDS